MKECYIKYVFDQEGGIYMVEDKLLKDIIEEWKEDKKQYVKKSTFAAYQLLIQNHILPRFGEMKEVKEEDVQTFALEKLNAGLNEKTIKDIIIVLKMILKFAVKNGYLDYVQIDVKFPTNQQKKELEVFSKSDQKKFMNYLRDNFTFKNLGIFICLSTGMRIGEICGLRWQDVDVDDGVIMVRHTLQRIYILDEGERHTEIILDTPKTSNSIRDIPMSSELLRIMKQFNKVVNDDYFVISNDINPIEPRTYRNYYKILYLIFNYPHKHYTFKHFEV